MKKLDKNLLAVVMTASMAGNAICVSVASATSLSKDDASPKNGRIMNLSKEGEDTLYLKLEKNVEIPVKLSRSSDVLIQKSGPKDFRGWYAKLELGLGIPLAFTKSQTDIGAAGVDNYYRNYKLRNGLLGGLGLGYQFNKHVWGDVTAHYLTAALNQLNVPMSNAGSPTMFEFVDVSQNIKSAFGLVNMYLGGPLQIAKDAHYQIIPFVTAGVGYAHNAPQLLSARNELTKTTYNRVGIPTNALAFSAGAGVDFRLTDNLSLECMYKYISLGNIMSDVNRTPALNKVAAGKLQLQAFTVGLKILF